MNGNYNPQPPEYRTLGNNVIEELHCKLLSLNQPSAFLDILVPLKEWLNMITPIHYLLK